MRVSYTHRPYHSLPHMHVRMSEMHVSTFHFLHALFLRGDISHDGWKINETHMNNVSATATKRRVKMKIRAPYTYLNGKEPKVIIQHKLGEIHRVNILPFFIYFESNTRFNKIFTSFFFDTYFDVSLLSTSPVSIFYSMSRI